MIPVVPNNKIWRQLKPNIFSTVQCILLVNGYLESYSQISFIWFKNGDFQHWTIHCLVCWTANVFETGPFRNTFVYSVWLKLVLFLLKRRYKHACTITQKFYRYFAILKKNEKKNGISCLLLDEWVIYIYLYIYAVGKRCILILLILFMKYKSLLMIFHMKWKQNSVIASRLHDFVDFNPLHHVMLQL